MFSTSFTLLQPAKSIHSEMAGNEEEKQELPGVTTQPE